MARQRKTNVIRAAYSLLEVAEQYGVSVQTVRRWSGRGYFPIHRLDGRNYVMADDLARFNATIRSRCFAPDPDAAAGS